VLAGTGVQLATKHVSGQLSPLAKLPSSQVSDVEANVDAIKVTFNAPGEFHVDDDRYDLDGVIQFLSDQHQQDPLRRLVLRADSGLKYGQIREFMARSQQIGFPGLNFMVGEKAKDGAQATADYAGRQEAAPEGAAPDAAAPTPADAPAGDQTAPAGEPSPPADQPPAAAPADAGAGGDPWQSPSARSAAGRRSSTR
jgi:biopolymer transport protein ExbD